MQGYSKAANTKPLPGIQTGYINPHAQFPIIPQHNHYNVFFKHCKRIEDSTDVDNSSIEPYTSKGLGK